MREIEFKEYLLRGHSEKSTKTRIRSGYKVEELLHKDLEKIVCDDNVMYDSLVKLEDFDNKERAPLQNALRKYYEFKNGREFPRKSDYRR